MTEEHHGHHAGGNWPKENTIALGIIMAGLLVSISVLLSAGAINANLSGVSSQIAGIGAIQASAAAKTVQVQAPAQQPAAAPTAPPAQAAPEPQKVDVGSLNADGRPAKGSANPKITIVEFSDFECPFCGRAQPTLKQLMQDYPDKIQLIFKHFPLGFHPNAQKAGEAAECAGKQGKFWEMHDKLFENQQALTVESLKKYAGDLKLDTAKFNSCLDSGETASTVQNDQKDGSAAGVSGTPSFFINGEMVVGAQPVSSFKAVIDRQLAG